MALTIDLNHYSGTKNMQTNTNAPLLVDSRQRSLSQYRIHHNDGIMYMEAKHKADLISNLHKMYPDLRIIAMAFIDNKGTPHYFHK